MDIREKHKKKKINITSSKAVHNSQFSVSWDKPTFAKNDESYREDYWSELSKRKMSWLEAHKEVLTIPIPVHTWHILVFTGLIVLITVPFALSAYAKTIELEKEDIQKTLSSTISLFHSGIREIQSGDTNKAKETFTKAHSLFAKQELSLRINHPFVAAATNVVPQQYSSWQSVNDALEAGRLSAKSGVIISDALSRVYEKKTELSEKEVEALLRTTAEVTRIIERIGTLVSRIDPSTVPKNDREFIIRLQGALPGIKADINKSIQKIHFAAEILGYSGGEKKILFLFQNNSELRATGGFLGSYALLRIDGGKIDIIDAPGGGTYEFQGTVRKVYASPEPLHLINPLWQFQDANWWPDWQASAEKIAWFYENGDGATADYVVGVTPTILERLLRITGPIQLSSDRGMYIDNKNVYDILQTRTNVPGAETAPKQIVVDAFTAVLERMQMLDMDEIRAFAPIVQESLEQKHLLLYARNNEDKKVIHENKWGGDIGKTDGDFFMAVHTNIAGGKSDRDIKDRVSLSSKVDHDGKIINSLTVTRTHHGRDGVGFGGVRNVDYIRVYVPREAELIDVTGYKKPPAHLFETPPEGLSPDPDIARFETYVTTHEASDTVITRSFGKTVFGNWLMVDPGTSASITFTYNLPFRINEDAYHTLTALKQPGLEGAIFDYTLESPYFELGEGSAGEEKEVYSVSEVMLTDIKKEIFIQKR